MTWRPSSREQLPKTETTPGLALSHGAVELRGSPWLKKDQNGTKRIPRDDPRHTQDGGGERPTVCGQKGAPDTEGGTWEKPAHTG